MINLRAELTRNLSELGFEKLTPIQEKSIPIILTGDDLIAKAKTGSGKTAAFSLPLLDKLEISHKYPQGLILCPTRELAEQVAKEVRTLARMLKNVKVLTICGGTSEYHQEKSLLHGVHLIVGTPGRVLKFLKGNSIETDFIRSLVLDEADRMLDMGFYNDIESINSHLENKKQTLLFSATYPEKFKELSQNIQTDPIEVEVDTVHEKGNIQESFYEVDSHKDKNQALLNILASIKPERFIVFCKTKRIADDLSEFLNRQCIESAAIHGDLEQKERISTLAKFTNKSLSCLVATDVASRGIDIKELDAVINYDLPNDPEVYVHRIGRTGRAGREGLSFSLLTPNTLYQLDSIEELTGESYSISEIPDSGDERYDLTPEWMTIFISGGKRDKLRPGDILGALVKEAGLKPDQVGDILILNVLSYVAVKSVVAEQAIDKLSNGRVKNRKFRVGLTD